jgi:hypothetical protein
MEAEGKGKESGRGEKREGFMQMRNTRTRIKFHFRFRVLRPNLKLDPHHCTQKSDVLIIISYFLLFYLLKKYDILVSPVQNRIIFFIY